MFAHSEDKMLEAGPTWHGTALGWAEDAGKHVTKVPIVSERFCGVKYSDKTVNISILAYTAVKQSLLKCSIFPY